MTKFAAFVNPPFFPNNKKLSNHLIYRIYHVVAIFLNSLALISLIFVFSLSLYNTFKLVTAKSEPLIKIPTLSSGWNHRDEYPISELQNKFEALLLDAGRPQESIATNSAKFREELIFGTIKDGLITLIIESMPGGPVYGSKEYYAYDWKDNLTEPYLVGLGIIVFFQCIILIFAYTLLYLFRITAKPLYVHTVNEKVKILIYLSLYLGTLFLIMFSTYKAEKMTQFVVVANIVTDEPTPTPTRVLPSPTLTQEQFEEKQAKCFDLKTTNKVITDTPFTYSEPGIKYLTFTGIVRNICKETLYPPDVRIRIEKDGQLIDNATTFDPLSPEYITILKKELLPEQAKEFSYELRLLPGEESRDYSLEWNI